MALNLDESKKKTVLVIALGIGVSLLLLILLLIFSGKGKEEKKGEGEEVATENAISEVPDAEESSKRDSKRSIYRSQGDKAPSEDYWDALEGKDGSSPADDVTSDGPAGHSGSGTPKKKDEPRYVSADSFEDDVRRKAGSTSSGGHTESEADRNYRLRMEAQEAAAKRAADQRDELIAELRRRNGEGQQAAQEEQPKEETPAPAPGPDTIKVERVQVRRTGSVSTLDDGYVSAGSSGISSLDASDDIYSAEEQYPFRCMFVRDEKVKNGSRVAVRLLEDMVIDGQLVPKNTHLQAICMLGTRLDMTISTLDLGGKLISFDYEAYDNDGAKGLYYPNAKDDKKEEQLKNQAQSSLFSRMSSTAGRLAQDAVQMGRIIVSSTGKETTVSVPAGYQFYLVKKVR